MFKCCRILGLLCLGALFIVSICGLVEASAEELPKMSFASRAYDFGTVSQGTVVRHEFQLRNVGNAPLLIDRIVPICGCVASLTVAGAVPPGESRGVSVEFNTTGFSGHIDNSIRVYSNDPDERFAVLTLQGRVEPYLLVTPPKVSFGVVAQGSEAFAKPQLVQIRTVGDTERRILDVRPYVKGMVVEVLRSDPQVWELSLSIDPKITPGQIRGRLLVKIDGPEPLTMNVPVFANIKPELEFDPTTLSFGVVQGETLLKRVVELVNHGAESIDPVTVSTKGKALAAEVETTLEGKRYMISIELDPTQVERRFQGVVEVEVGSEKKPLSFSVKAFRPVRSK